MECLAHHDPSKNLNHFFLYSFSFSLSLSFCLSSLISSFFSFSVSVDRLSSLRRYRRRLSAPRVRSPRTRLIPQARPGLVPLFSIHLAEFDVSVSFRFIAAAVKRSPVCSRNLWKCENATDCRFRLCDDRLAKLSPLSRQITPRPTKFREMSAAETHRFAFFARSSKVVRMKRNGNADGDGKRGCYSEHWNY